MRQPLAGGPSVELPPPFRSNKALAQDGSRIGTDSFSSFLWRVFDMWKAVSAPEIRDGLLPEMTYPGRARSFRFVSFR